MTALALPRRAPRLRDQVYDAIRAMLRDGVYPDAALAEDALAAQLQVSRTPVREALFQLCREGILEDTGRGYRRPAVTADDVREVVELRRLLEPGMAGSIATTATTATRATFRAIVAREAKHVADADAAPFIAANAAFRAAFVDAFGNRRVTQVMQTVDDQVAHLRQLTLGAAANRRATLAAHRRFIAALDAGDAMAASSAMGALIDAASSYYESLW